MIFLTFCSLHFFVSSLETVLRFEDLPEQEALGVPFSIGHSNQGDLYVLDAPRSRIHVWGPNGKYRYSFGQAGPGPGEISRAVKLVVHENQVLVWGYNGNRLSRFTLNGRFLEEHKTPFRYNQFGVINPELLLIAYKKHASNTLTEVPFQLVDLKGSVTKTMVTYPHEGYLTPKSGATRIKAYGPEIAIQQGPEGTWHYGFSQTNQIFEMDASGRVLAEKRFALPEMKATDADREAHGQVAFANYRGTRTEFKKMGRLHFDFDYPMAFYTQFVVTENQVIFVLTPLGGFGAGAGYHRGRFYTCDRNSGALLGSGIYALEEDSKILFSRGKGVAFVPGESGDYQVLEVTLTGKARP